jgi:signal transduction histidine kinase
MLGMSWLGYYSITIWEEGLRGARIGQFAQAAEQIRNDVRRKLDAFMQQERSRPYTDYQYYYVPENVAPNQQTTVLVSHLKDKMSNGLAYGYFQIERGGRITTPYFDASRVTDAGEDAVVNEAKEYVEQLSRELLPSVKISSHTLSVSMAAQMQKTDEKAVEEKKKAGPPPPAIAYNEQSHIANKTSSAGKPELKIESLLGGSRKSQVVVQNRALVEENAYSNDSMQTAQRQDMGTQAARPSGNEVSVSQPSLDVASAQEAQPGAQQPDKEMVNIIIEPFVPMVVSGDKDSGSIFAGQIYLLRHVKIEDRDIIQGFRFDQKRLLEEVRDSSRIIPQDMGFELSPGPTSNAAYTAVLSFGRGEVPIGLKDKDPDRIARQVASLRNWYFGVVAVVFVAVAMGLTSVWQNVYAHASLARKKDDFISAVSHELRTPLTSIRMHSEMLENKWVKSEEKASEYYRSMRQESERLSRLIENVLDFSRIQRGRKKYNFAVGDLNKCIADVVEMMKPYAAQSGFTIQVDLGTLTPTKFDKDALTQIVVNLLDNAVKYARAADEKIVYVRTRQDGQHAIIEVEDRGPGLPHRERKKVFEQFYRVAAESTREVPGTGLGLAIVKKFVEAHKGFVEVLAAKPMGAVFRVGLPIGN